MDKKISRRALVEMVGAGLGAASIGGLTGCAAPLDPDYAPEAGQDPIDGSANALLAPPPTQKFAMLLYPGLTVLDLIGPLTSLSLLGTVHLVWKDLDPVMSADGVALMPNTTFEQCPQDLDVLLVPGSLNDTATMMRDTEVTEFLRDRGQRARYVTSVCTGSLILAAAGLLEGYRATSHWITLDFLRLMGARPRSRRLVRHGNRITAAGVTAGIELGLRLTEILTNRGLAEVAELAMEYAPDPPYGTGHPSTASPVLVLGLRALWAPMLADTRQAAIDVAT